MKTKLIILGAGVFLGGAAATAAIDGARGSAAPSANMVCGLRTVVEAPGLPGGVQSIDYCRQGGMDIAHGDIILPSTSQSPLDGATVHRVSQLWPRGVVPIVVDSSLSDASRVWDAISHWQKYTSIRFVHRSNEADYVSFVPGNNCSSSIGRVGGEQTIVLASGCLTGAVIHEIGHAMGLWHEQSRTDRDQHVDILWDNITSGHQFNFAKFDGDGYNHGAYDYDSVMHYPAHAFSKNGRPTIVVKGTATPVGGGGSTLSSGDVAAIQYLY